MIYWYTFLLIAFLAFAYASYRFFTSGNMGHTSGLGNGFLGAGCAVIAAAIVGVALITFIGSLFF